MDNSLKQKVIRVDTLKRPYGISDKDWDFCKDVRVNICTKDSISGGEGQRLGLSVFPEKEIFVDERGGYYIVYHEIGHILSYLHSEDINKNRVFLENSYLLENKKFINNSVYGKNNYFCIFIEYIVQAYSDCIIHPYRFKIRYPYTYDVLIKIGFIEDTYTDKYLSYSLLNILLRMEVRDDYHYIENLSSSYRAKLCEALLYRNFSEEVQKILNKCKKDSIKKIPRKFVPV